MVHPRSETPNTFMIDLTRIKEKLEESIELSFRETPIDIVVMGPGLDETTDAAVLRRDIIDAASEYGVTIQPEHRGLIETSEELLEGGHHLTAFETHLVAISDLVVLIPDSPGSLCELGLFSTYEEAAKKMLVLASDDYPRQGTYVSDGPLTAAAHNLAEVHYLNYSDFDTAWRHVKNRLQRIRTERSLRKIKGRRR